jgi:hypothetical protein
MIWKAVKRFAFRSWPQIGHEICEALLAPPPFAHRDTVRAIICVVGAVRISAALNCALPRPIRRGAGKPVFLIQPSFVPGAASSLRFLKSQATATLNAAVSQVTAVGYCAVAAIANAVPKHIAAGPAFANGAPGYNQAFKPLPDEVDKTAHLFVAFGHGGAERCASAIWLQVGGLCGSGRGLLEAIAPPSGLLGWAVAAAAFAASGYGVRCHACYVLCEVS